MNTFFEGVGWGFGLFTGVMAGVVVLKTMVEVVEFFSNVIGGFNVSERKSR